MFFLNEIEHNSYRETNESCIDDLSENISEEIESNNNSENNSCKDYLSGNISEEMECNNYSETNDINRED